MPAVHGVVQRFDSATPPGLEIIVRERRPGDRRRSALEDQLPTLGTVMGTKFTQLNHGWNAEPNAPEMAVNVEGTTLTLSFLANPWQFPEFVEGQIIRLRFTDVSRYAIGHVNDEGWYRGQCRFSKLAPRWGEFYEVSGDLRLDQLAADWHVVSETPANNLRHFLFYFRDENFECDAASWDRIQ